MSSIKLKGSSSGDVTITVPAAAGTNTVTIPAATGTLPLSNLDHVTNRQNAIPLIYNGEFMINQRGTVTGITANGTKVLDRFRCDFAGDWVWTASQDTSVPSGSGLSKSMKIQNTTADASPGASDICVFNTHFEGFDVNQLKYGTSDAEATTLAFWVKSNKTGNFQVNLRMEEAYHIGQLVAISSADTWEKKVLNFAGNTSNAIPNDNTEGLRIQWFLNAGSNSKGGNTPTSWEAVTADESYSSANLDLGGSTDDNFFITGVQWEVGTYTSATLPPFQHETPHQALIRCQRYLQIYEQPPLFGSANANNTIARARFGLITPMRAGPTATQSGTFSWFYSNSHQPTSTAFSATYTDTQTFEADVTVSGTGMTATHPCGVFQSGSATLILDSDF